MTLKAKLIELLKEGWMSNYEMEQAIKSSSGGSMARKIRQNPPEGYKMIQRPKEVPEGYNKCLEFRLVRIEEVDRRVVQPREVNYTQLGLY